VAFHGPEASALLRERLGDQDLGKLSEREEAVIKQRMAALDKLFKDKVSAKYKLEVQFHEKRSYRDPYMGIMCFMSNGDKFHGGGDSKVYLCDQNNCRGIVTPTEHAVVDLNEDPEQNRALKVVCPKCNKISYAKDLLGERLLRLTTQNWATALVNNFRYLESCADVRLIFHHSDLQRQTALEMEKGADGDIINKARNSRKKAIYPWRHILIDTAHGADLHGRFFAFLNGS
jgi:hypothetical protein